MRCNVSVRVFFSGLYPKSHKYACAVTAMLREQRPEIAATVESVDAAVQEWERLGLQSCPAVVFYAQGRPVGNIVSYADDATILSRLKGLQSATPETLGDSSDLSDTWDCELLGEKVEIPYTVVGSSGCHRYLRWHEDNVRSSDRHTGWCSPSGRQAGEFIVLEMPAGALLKELFVGGRRRTDGTFSPRSFPKAFAVETAHSLSGPWLPALHFERDTCDTCFASLTFCEETCAPFLRIRILEKHDIDGKTFPCIAVLRLLGSMGASTPPLQVKRRLARGGASTSSLQKYGLSANEHGMVELYELSANQRLPACWCTGSRSVYAVKGLLIVRVDHRYETQLDQDDCIHTEPSTILEISAGAQPASALVISFGNNLRQVWEAR